MVSLISKIEVIPDFFQMTFMSKNIAEQALPGQFLMLRIQNDSYDPLLRRPISIMTANSSGHVEFLFKVVGRGTRKLSKLMAGDNLDVIGPLGTGFTLGKPGTTPVLIGGGIGLPPLLFLAERLVKTGAEPIVIIGAKTGEEMILVERFQSICNRVILATDDGSTGFSGTAVNAFESLISGDRTIRNPVVYACGPKGMLKALVVLTGHHKIPAQVSLENVMGCGVGACLGCVVGTTDGLKRVCKDGPVFNSMALTEW